METISSKIRLKNHNPGLMAYVGIDLVEEIDMKKGDFLIPKFISHPDLGRKLIREDPVLKDMVLMFEFRRNTRNKVLDIIGDFEE